MLQNTSTVNSGNTSVFLDLETLESAAGITLIGADSSGTAFDDSFQVGFPIIEDTDFTFEIEPFAPVSGTVEHSGTVILGLGEAEITLGEFSIGFDAERNSETASGFFVADTTADALGLEILFDVGAPGNLSTDGEFVVSEADLLLAPELADALSSPDLALADIGDTRIDATTVSPKMMEEAEITEETEASEEAEAETIGDMAVEGESGTAKNVIIMVGDGMGWDIARAAAI